MKHMRNPLDVTWYYVPTYNEYFEYVEHDGDMVILKSNNLIGTLFGVYEDECRIATYEEVRRFNNIE